MVIKKGGWSCPVLRSWRRLGKSTGRLAGCTAKAFWNGKDDGWPARKCFMHKILYMQPRVCRKDNFFVGNLKVDCWDLIFWHQELWELIKIVFLCSRVVCQRIRVQLMVILIRLLSTYKDWVYCYGRHSLKWTLIRNLKHWVTTRLWWRCGRNPVTLKAICWAGHERI